MAKAKPKKRTNAELVQEVRKQQAVGKACYGKADKLLSELAKRTKGRNIRCPNGTAKIVDDFVGQTVVFRPAAFRRYRLEYEPKAA